MEIGKLAQCNWRPSAGMPPTSPWPIGTSAVLRSRLAGVIVRRAGIVCRYAGWPGMMPALHALVAHCCPILSRGGNKMLQINENCSTLRNLSRLVGYLPRYIAPLMMKGSDGNEYQLFHFHPGFQEYPDSRKVSE
jgi:hypothetical protein